MTEYGGFGYELPCAGIKEIEVHDGGLVLTLHDGACLKAVRWDQIEDLYTSDEDITICWAHREGSEPSGQYPDPALEDEPPEPVPDLAARIMAAWRAWCVRQLQHRDDPPCPGCGAIGTLPTHAGDCACVAYMQRAAALEEGLEAVRNYIATGVSHPSPAQPAPLPGPVADAVYWLRWCALEDQEEGKAGRLRAAPLLAALEALAAWATAQQERDARLAALCREIADAIEAHAGFIVSSRQASYPERLRAAAAELAGDGGGVP